MKLNKSGLILGLIVLLGATPIMDASLGSWAKRYWKPLMAAAGATVAGLYLRYKRVEIDPSYSLAQSKEDQSKRQAIESNMNKFDLGRMFGQQNPYQNAYNKSFNDRSLGTAKIRVTQFLGYRARDLLEATIHKESDRLFDAINNPYRLARHYLYAQPHVTDLKRISTNYFKDKIFTTLQATVEFREERRDGYQVELLWQCRSIPTLDKLYNQLQ